MVIVNGSFGSPSVRAKRDAMNDPTAQASAATRIASVQAVTAVGDAGR